MSERPCLSGWRYRAVVLSALLSALGYLAVALWGGWPGVGRALARVGGSGIAGALLLSLLNYALRFLRWQGYLGVLGHPVPWRPGLRIYLAGFALTTTPGKAGEALRGVLLKPLGVPYPQSFAAFVSERLSDLLGVVLLALSGLTLYPAARPLIGAGAALVGAGFVLLSQRRLLDRLGGWLPAAPGRLPSLLRHLVHILREARHCHRPGRLLGATLLSLLAWSAEALAFHGILHWLGADLPLAFAVFVYALAMLAGALSFMPGGLGGAEAVMVALLVWQGVPGADAIAAALLIRLATLWFAVALGMFCLSLSRSARPA